MIKKQSILLMSLLITLINCKAGMMAFPSLQTGRLYPITNRPRIVAGPLGLHSLNAITVFYRASVV
jgi:hypothetical protein